MAAAQGLSPASIHRIWHAHGLQPHRVRTFKLSTDPRFVEKLTDVVGLYVDPPDKALVFCVDEKSQIQALQRPQPGLPMKPGRAGTMTHDYKRHGTTTLFAALNVLEGTVIGSCLARHRHQEFRKFLNLLDAETPPDMEIHAIVDNYATHKHPAIQRWLRRHPRFHLHFVPTSASWLNLVEVWFSHLTTEQVRRGDFLSVPDLIDAIYAYIHNHNQHAVPFIWTAPAERLLEKVMKCRAVLNHCTSILLPAEGHHVPAERADQPAWHQGERADKDAVVHGAPPPLVQARRHGKPLRDDRQEGATRNRRPAARTACSRLGEMVAVLIRDLAGLWGMPDSCIPDNLQVRISLK